MIFRILSRISRKIWAVFRPQSGGWLIGGSQNLPPTSRRRGSKPSELYRRRSAVAGLQLFVKPDTSWAVLTQWYHQSDGCHGTLIAAVWANVIIRSWAKNILHCIFLPGRVNCCMCVWGQVSAPPPAWGLVCWAVSYAQRRYRCIDGVLTTCQWRSGGVDLYMRIALYARIYGISEMWKQVLTSPLDSATSISISSKRAMQ